MYYWRFVKDNSEKYYDLLFDFAVLDAESTIVGTCAGVGAGGSCGSIWACTCGWAVVARVTAV